MRTIFYTLFCAVLLLIGACQLENKGNPHGLPLVSSLKEYKKNVESRPELKMVDLEKSIEGLVLDIRYATTNNFTGEVIYKAPKAFARQPVAHALKMVQDSLAHHGLGLKIFDAYRPYAATLRFFEVYPNTDYVADPKRGSRHNRGCAIDLTLIKLENGEELEMPTAFDDFSERAHSEYDKLAIHIIKNRTFLFGVMKEFGFTPIKSEWWHFDYQGWENFPLLDLAFQELED